ncbi:polysaccharide deacetylase family protein [Variovorax sp.]|uniref:polysaccharide deacetylase family protein n=1 Tax=Variovorax sp. TaxID=1871043 RepID=UPI002D510DE3|nr:polysaccharide deacetylase family protein [Variovorax sp.]HYP84617.1 polysaccharide deacetylase family protein [Variovorax sp.]
MSRVKPALTSWLGGLALLALSVAAPLAGAEEACNKPVYLTFDTGTMSVAPLVAQVLDRQHVRVTFFAAAERTIEGGDSLDNHWRDWWRARADAGDEFASHTYDHVYWRGDEKSVEPRFRVRPSAGALADREFTWTAAQYCANIAQSEQRLLDLTGKKPLPLFRAPGGKISNKLLAAARKCGYAHVGWSAAGFLGDELPSDKYPNDKLLAQALRDIRPGDILLAHLGIRSRQDPWAPAVLEPLITGLKERGFCFRTMREHPDYQGWFAARADAAAAPGATAR